MAFTEHKVTHTPATDTLVYYGSASMFEVK